MGTDEIAVLVKMYPQCALWLASGNTALEVGQTSPGYDKENSNLPDQDAGWRSPKERLCAGIPKVRSEKRIEHAFGQ
jgi:hypothetical protein